MNNSEISCMREFHVSLTEYLKRNFLCTTYTTIKYSLVCYVLLKWKKKFNFSVINTSTTRGIFAFIKLIFLAPK